MSNFLIFTDFYFFISRLTLVDKYEVKLYDNKNFNCKSTLNITWLEKTSGLGIGTWQRARLKDCGL
jgi:hypothetical protein